MTLRQWIEVECQRCKRAYTYPVMAEDGIFEVMRRVALVHAQNSHDCSKRYKASGIVVKHPDASTPLFPVGKEAA